MAEDEVENCLPPQGNFHSSAKTDEVNEVKEKKGQVIKSIFTDEIGNLKFVNFVVRHPVKLFISLIALCILSSIVLIILSRRDGSPFTDRENDYVLSDVRSIAYDSLSLADKEVRQDEENEEALTGKDQEGTGDITYWIYEAETADGLFTKEAIPYMREAESTIIDNQNYPNYCVLEYSTTTEGIDVAQCQKPLSVLTIYYASFWNSSLAQEVIEEISSADNRELYNALAPCVEFGVRCDILPSGTTTAQITFVSKISKNIETIISTWDGKGELNPDVDEVTTFIAYMNELATKQFYVNFFFDKNFDISNPIVKYSRSILYWGELLNGTTTIDESDEERRSFIVDNLLDSMNKIIKKDNNDEVQSYFFMGALIFDIILGILTADGLKAIASFVAVFFYLRVMIGSWFLAAVGMFEMFMSLPLAWLSFSYIFQIKYFDSLNVLCIFIVLAIGADDIFVFMDAYKQSANKGEEVVSSLETRLSWVYRRSGWAMLLTSATTCSAFIGTLISPITSTGSFGIFAAFVIFFDYLLVMSLFCTSVVIYHNYFETGPNCCSCSCSATDVTTTDIAMAKGPGGDVELDRISLFFKEKVGPFILKGRNRIILAIPFLAFIVITAIYAAKLEPTTSAEQFLDDDHPIQKASTILSNEFPKTQEDETSKIFFIWGLDEVDRSGVNQFFNPGFVGEPVFVEDFSFNEECQTAMLNACEILRTDSRFEEFILKKNGLRSVDCFVEELGAFNVLNDTLSYVERCVDLRAQEWTDGDWPVPVSKLTSTIESFANTTSCYESESVIDYYGSSMGWDKSTLRYAGLSVDSSLLDQYSVKPEEVVRRHYDTFIKFAEELDDTMERVCQSKTIMTDLNQNFILMNNQRIYRRNALGGSIFGVLVAFVILFLSTRKLHVSLFACLSILGVLIGVVGSITIFGWTLGTIEAILIAILAGFSVDYVIHLAHAYVHSEGNTDERIIEAYSTMGISVFSGALTSVVASIPLFFCTLTFFAKFGTFLCLTIVLSWIFANFGFMSLLAQFKIPMNKGWL